MSMRGVKENVLEIVRRTGDVHDAEILLVKTLQYSTVARVSVRYRDRIDDPRSLFVKLTPPKHGEEEVRFYTCVAPMSARPPLFKCHFAEADLASGLSGLVFDDLSETHAQPLSGTPPDMNASGLAVRSLAQIHARWWDDPQLGKLVGKRFDEASLRDFLENLDRDVPRFLDAVSGAIEPRQKEAIALMLERADRIWGRIVRTRGITVTHGDAHWWNFLYPIDPLSSEVYIFDWQLWHLDIGARDLAFLIALGGFAEPRPELEMALLALYHDTLLANGVADYSRDDLQTDYRWSEIRNLNIPVIFWIQGKEDAVWRIALRRAFDAYERLDCRELVA